MNDANAIELSVVLPCLDEAETLETCIRKAQGFFEDHKVRGEVIIGDNGSTDGSIEIAQRLGARVIHVSQRGYGSALYSGTKAARGRYVIMADADDSYDLVNLGPFLEQLRQGHDLVMGNRFAGGIKPGAMPWKNRHLGNPVLTGIGRLFFRSPAKDFHCGIRGFTKDAFERMDLRTTGMEYASEMVIKATLLGMRICEVPTTLSPDGRSRRPHLRPWRDGWRHLRFMLLYSPRWLFLYPGLLLMAVGLVLGIRLLIAPMQIGNLEFDVHTLIYCAGMVSIGFQLVTFAALAAVFATQEGLAPPYPRLQKLFKLITLDASLLGGGLLMLGGVVGAVAALLAWGDQGFGALHTGRITKTVIGSVVALMLGAQVIFNGFFLSVLGLGVRRAGTDPDGSQAE
ncbi:MAG: glycosyltransferase family 2 protein [Planctomycetota bacterium]|jgi:glycosyltransferase involved in cell wall biosynthesis